MLPIVSMIPATIVAGMLLPLLSTLHSANVLGIFEIAVGVSVVGAVLLFLARLPLYRRRRFWTVGPGELDVFHRWLYWVAYAFVLAGFGLLGVVWFRTLG